MVGKSLSSFTETGILPDSLQTLLGADIEAPNAIRSLLSREIRVPKFVDKFLNSPTGEFVLNQLEDTIGSPSGRTDQDLLSLKSAFNTAASDHTISFLELVDRYPQNTVRLDVTSLERTYNRVSNFIEQVLPALVVAKGFLSDIICDCEPSAASPDDSSAYASQGSIYTSESKPCNSATHPTVATDSSDLNSSEVSHELDSENIVQLSQSAQ